MEGPPVTVRYSPGSLDRASRVQRRMTRLVAESGHRKLLQQLLEIDLLRPEEWRSYGLAEPYGMPAITGSGSLALPAWGGAETVALWQRLLGGWLPSTPGSPMRGSPDETASLEGADLMGEVEASRIVLSRLGIVGNEPWMNDLMACVLAVSAVQRSEPGRWAEVRQFHSRLAVRPEAAGDQRLARLRFIAAAERIGSESGSLPSKPLFKMARKAKGPLPPEHLLERYPWLAELRTAAPVN
jgi:hypothetical protein